MQELYFCCTFFHIHLPPNESELPHKLPSSPFPQIF